MKKFNLLRKSERKSVGTTLALTVGSPSVDRRYSALKHLTFILLFLLGSLNVWGEEVEIVSTFAKVKNESPTASFTASNTGNNNVYSTGTTFTITSKENNVWALAPSTSESIYFSMNNSEGGFHLGSKNYDAGDATLTSSTSFLNVTQIKISGKTGKSGSVTISVKVGNTSISLKQGSSATFSGSTVATATFISASPISGTVEVTMTDGASNIAYYIESITITTSSDSSDPTACAEPTFSPAAGAVVSGTNVSISSTTEGATIYYTTDGSTPTTSSATSQPIEITAATTIKAIAVKGGMDNSDVASASYTIVTPYTSIANLADAMTNLDQSVYVTFGGWQVSVVKNSQAFVTDGTNGLIIYQSGHGLVEGDILTGTVQCTLVSYNGVVELKGVTKTMDGIAVTSGTISPVVKTIAEANDLTALNTGLLIKLENVTYNGTAFVDAGSNTIAPYNTFYSYSLTSGQKYNVTGIVQQYQSNSQIYPRKAEDIEALTTIATPTFSPAAGEYTEIQTVTISCTTDGATVYYTTDGTNPTNESTVYSSAIEVGASMTIKAIAYKGEDHSEVVSATYTINIPIPSHDFQITHKFETGEGFEFPADWDGDYEGHEISYTDDKVVFASANKQSSGQTIDDCPVTKGHAISLVLTNSSKLISAVRFDYKQWGAKAQTLTMKYSTDGGANYSDFEPALTATNFAIQALSLPAGVNAIQVTGSNSNNQVGLTSIAFDLANKPVVTKTVTITPPSNGTLVVKNAGVAITSGEAIEVGTTLTIEATPNEGYSLSGVTVNGNAYTEATLTLTENVTIAATFVVDVRPAASLKLWENGNEVAYPGDYKQNDHVALPNSVTHNCYGREFVGWSTTEIAQTDTKPAYLEPGADFTLSAAGVNNLYAVYAVEGAATSDYKLSTQAPAAGETVIISRLVESTYYALTNAATPASAELTLNAGVVESPNDAVLWDVEAATDGVYLRPTGSADGLHMNSSALKVASGDTNGDIKFTANGDGSFKATRSDDARWIVVGGTNSFTCSSAESNAVALYIFKAIHNYSKYSTTCDEAIDAPIFDPVEGIYTSAKNITIAAATGATIYYTMTDDGSEPADPTQSSDVYSSAIPLNAAGTYKFKAFAVKGEAESDIAEATYTINLPLTTIPAIFNAATTTSTTRMITFDNWVVSGVKADGTQAFLTDGTNGIILFHKNVDMQLEVGNTLSGTKECSLILFNGAAELQDFSKEGLTVGTNGEVNPAPKSIAELSGVNTGAPIIVENVKFDGTDLVDASNNKIQPFTTLFAGAVTSLTENKYYNVTGIYTQYNSKKEILPRSAADIDELTQEAPTMTWYTSDAKAATIAVNATYTINLGDAFAPVFETNSSGTRTYSSNNDAVATINASTGALALQGGTGDVLITCTVAEDAVNNYAAGSQSFTLHVREAVAGENVVIVAQYDGKWYAMKNIFTGTKTAEAIEVTYADGKIWDLPTADQEAITWVRTVDEGNVTFQAPNGNYLKTSSNDLALEAGESGNYQWNWNSTYYRTGEQTRTFMYRGGSVTGFRSYAVSNAETSDYSALPVVTAAVFATTPEVIRGGLSDGKWGTLCPKQNVEEVEGATFYQISYLEEQEGMPYNVVFDAISGTTLTAGQPYFFIAEGTEIRGIKSGDAVTSGSHVNGFYGWISPTDESMELTTWHEDYDAGADNTYVIYGNSVLRINQGGTMLKSERCYININSTEPSRSSISPMPGRNRIRMSVQNTNTATGMDAINASEKPMKMVIEGQLYILRGEKMYNANGQIVK